MVMFTDPRAFRTPTNVVRFTAAASAVLAGACPVAVVPSLLTLAISTTTAAYMTIAAGRRQRLRTEMCRHRWFDLYTDEIPDLGPEWVYVGQGYQFSEEHRKLYKAMVSTKANPVQDLQAELIAEGKWPSPDLVPAGRSPVDLAEQEWRKEGGDPRILALGFAELRSVYVRLEVFSQHAAIYGSTGVGKSRSIETLIAHCAKYGIALVIIDPKGDPGLSDLASNSARMYGRRFGWLSLANPRESGTWNPLSYTDPTELMTRISAVVPPSEQNPFWHAEPSQVAGSTLIFQAYLRKFLEACGSVEDHLAQVHRVFAKAAAAAIDAHRGIEVGDVQRAWASIATDDDPQIPDSDSMLFRLTSDGMSPSIEHLYRIAVIDPRALIGCAAKAMHPHLWIGVDPWDLAGYERQRTEKIRANDPKAHPFLVSAESHFKALMPLEDGWQPSSLRPVEGGPSITTDALVALWAPLVPKQGAIRSAIAKLRATSGDLLATAGKAEDERKKYCAMLGTGLGGFVGRQHLFSSPRPDIDLYRLIRNGEIAYFTLSTMKYGATAAAVSKMIVSTLAAIAGEQIATGATSTQVKKCLILIDECAAFAEGEKSMTVILQQARSAGLMMALLGQTRSAMQAALGSEGAFKDLDNNQLTKWQLKTSSRDEAKAAAEQFLRSTIEEVSGSTSVNPSVLGGGNAWTNMFSGGQSRNVSRTDVEPVPEDVFLALPKGVAVAKLENGLPWIIQCPRVLVRDCVSWYESLRLPLSEEAIQALERDKRPIPAWHFENLERKRALDAAEADGGKAVP